MAVKVDKRLVPPFQGVLNDPPGEFVGSPNQPLNPVVLPEPPQIDLRQDGIRSAPADYQHSKLYADRIAQLVEARQAKASPSNAKGVSLFFPNGPKNSEAAPHKLPSPTGASGRTISSIPEKFKARVTIGPVQPSNSSLVAAPSIFSVIHQQGQQESKPLKRRANENPETARQLKQAHAEQRKGPLQGADSISGQVQQVLAKRQQFLQEVGCVSFNELRKVSPRQVSGMRNILIQMIVNCTRAKSDAPPVFLEGLSSWKYVDEKDHYVKPTFILSFKGKAERLAFLERSKSESSMACTVVDGHYVWVQPCNGDAAKIHSILQRIYGPAFNQTQESPKVLFVDDHFKEAFSLKKQFPDIFLREVTFEELSKYSLDQLELLEFIFNQALLPEKQIDWKGCFKAPIKV